MTPCSHRRRRQTAVPCHTDSITVQNKGSAELGRVSRPCAIETMLVRPLVVAEEARKLWFLTTLTLSLYKIKVRQRLVRQLVSHGRVRAETLLVRRLVVTEEASKLRFLATLTINVLLKGLAEVGRVACVSWPCVCGDVACKTPYSHRSGTQTAVPCHTRSAGGELTETCACSSAHSSRSGTSSASRATLGNLPNNLVQF